MAVEPKLSERQQIAEALRLSRLEEASQPSDAAAVPSGSCLPIAADSGKHGLSTVPYAKHSRPYTFFASSDVVGVLILCSSIL